MEDRDEHDGRMENGLLAPSPLIHHHSPRLRHGREEERESAGRRRLTHLKVGVNERGADGRWKIANGRWQMANGKQGRARGGNGRWKRAKGEEGPAPSDVGVSGRFDPRIGCDEFRWG